MFWLEFIRTPFPDWMMYKNCEKQINKYGYNLAMIWLIRLKTPFPGSIDRNETGSLWYEGMEK